MRLNYVLFNESISCFDHDVLTPLKANSNSNFISVMQRLIWPEVYSYLRKDGYQRSLRDVFTENTVM